MNARFRWMSLLALASVLVVGLSACDKSDGGGEGGAEGEGSEGGGGAAAGPGTDGAVLGESVSTTMTVVNEGFTGATFVDFVVGDALRELSALGPDCVGASDSMTSNVRTVNVMHAQELTITAVTFDPGAAGPPGRARDLTLAVVGPNGTLCNDDAVGLNPQVSGMFGEGPYTIHVGMLDGVPAFSYVQITPGLPAE